MQAHRLKQADGPAYFLLDGSCGGHAAQHADGQRVFVHPVPAEPLFAQAAKRHPHGGNHKYRNGNKAHRAEVKHNRAVHLNKAQAATYCCAVGASGAARLVPMPCAA
ncbi:hypothetical protein SDC9_126455 [bioreactor metagenome]|uniref:Uncharacterized protein n=1 Tax=bioreactor metagenome TaxID=1076179 RepID=A0A645CRT6_9ZZZZ